MKRYRNWVGLCIGVLGLLIICSSDNHTYASNLPACNDDNSTVDIKVDSSKHVITLTANKGTVWNVYLQGGNPTGQYVIPETGTLEIPYSGEVDIEGDIDETTKKPTSGSSYAELVSSNTCALKKTVKGKEETYHVYYALTAESSELENSNDNWGVCQDFQNWAVGAGAVDYARKSFPYCYNPAPATNYEESYVISVINQLKDMWSLVGSIKNTYQEGFENAPEGYKKVDNTNIDKVDGVLKCDAFTKTENTNKYSYSAVRESNEVCDVVCREDLTVIYDAPISAKAGFCFTYTVEIKSKVTCQTKVKQPNPPTKEIACKPTSSCYHKKGAYTSKRGGPSNDFDACVKKCDNGKYTQKCIDQCYNKVYGKTTVAMVSYDDVLATKIANSGACDSKVSSVKGIRNLNFKSKTVQKNLAYYIGELRKVVRAGETGKFVKSGSTINWKAANQTCHWDNYGRSYFESKGDANKTVYQDYSKGLNSAYAGKKAKNYGPINGFSRANYNKKNACDAKCVWKGCANSDTTHLNQNLLDAEWQAKVNAYKANLEKCSTAVNSSACETKTTKFTMSVLPSNGDKEIEYEASNNPNSSANSSCKNPNGPDAIINTQSGACYGKGSATADSACSDDNENDYRTVINFPGTWRYDKLGTLTYEKPKSETGYTHIPNQFCPSNNFKNVNSEWWAWELQTKTDYTQSELDDIKSKLKYNIKAGTNNFGLFSWNINLECFYAMYNGEVNKKKVDPSCDLDSEDCVTTDITSYTYKAAALDELFAGDKKTTNSDETGRETGWNWSCDATDLTDKDYPIAPTALIADIQSKGESIYKNDSEYLDYSIELTPATINEIKRINKQQKNFLDYTGNKNRTNPKADVELRSVYRSQLLDELGSGVVKVRYTNTIGCNNREGDGCLTLDQINQNPDYCVTARNSLGK